MSACDSLGVSRSVLTFSVLHEVSRNLADHSLSDLGFPGLPVFAGDGTNLLVAKARNSSGSLGVSEEARDHAGDLGVWRGADHWVFSFHVLAHLCQVGVPVLCDGLACFLSGQGA